MFGYIAYIDESGDDGLKTVRPIDPMGSSEWFVLSAVVIRADREKETLDEVRRIRSRLSRMIRPDIHFRHMRDENKLLVCKEIAGLNARCFAVVSNKRNMRRYHNPSAAAVWSRNPFYCWITRLLLERVTTFCEARSRVDYGSPKPVKIVFSHRGGLSYGQLCAYLYKLRDQSRAGTLYLGQGDLAWSVVDLNQITSADHGQLEPLQLADCVASAFYEGVALKPNGTCNPEFAKLLKPRMWAPGGRIWKHGVMALPFNLRLAKLQLPQRELFEFYGYPKKGW